MRCRFAMCLRTLVWLTTACVFTLPGCGGGGGGESDGEGSVVPFQRETIEDAGRYFYSPRPGDIFHYSETMSVSGSGMSRMVKSEERKTYTQVEEIPAFYGCEDTLAGPFVLCVTTHDDETVRRTYLTMDGITLISDGMETFTNAFFMSGSGDDLEPDVIILGRTYRAVLEEVIFSSETGAIVGTETMEMSQTYDNEAVITVPAGTFETLQCTVECSISTTEYGRTRDSVMSGTIWLAKDVGEVKSSYVMTLSAGNNTITCYYDHLLSGVTKSVSNEAVATDRFSCPAGVITGRLSGILQDR